MFLWLHKDNKYKVLNLKSAAVIYFKAIVQVQI